LGQAFDRCGQAAFRESRARFDLFESLAGASYFIEDGLDAGGPDERCGSGIPSGEKLGDSALQFDHAVKDAAPNGLLAEFGEPALDQIEPARTGGDKVQHEPGMLFEPAPDPLVAVRAVVVQNQVQVFSRGELGIESLEKLQKLLMPVPGIALADHAAFGHLQAGKPGVLPHVRILPVASTKILPREGLEDRGRNGDRTRPSLRTGRADLPHPALQLVINLTRRPTGRDLGLRHAEQAQLGEVVVAPRLMICAPAAAALARALAQDRAKPAADVTIHA
jgi:hypothetical protein